MKNDVCGNEMNSLIIEVGSWRIIWLGLFYRIIGAVLIITGLYLVLWGKNEERKFAMQKTAIQSPADHGNNRTPVLPKSSLAQPLISQSTENVWSHSPRLLTLLPLSLKPIVLLNIYAKPCIVCVWNLMKFMPFSYIF